MKLLKRVFRVCLKIICLFLASFLLYMLSAWVLAFIPVNSDTKQPEEGITIYLQTSGVHLDITVPYQQDEFSWRDYLDLVDFDPNTVTPKFVSFGWGDKGFFLDTPNWSDLKASTAINALFLPSATAMHVSLKNYTPKISESTCKIILTPQQFKKLNRQILGSFKQENGKLIPISGNGYGGMNDKFYEANNSYHLFMTCNEWANSIFKETGLRTALWSPFDWGTLKYFE